jgi:hypothetical protein
VGQIERMMTEPQPIRRIIRSLVRRLGLGSSKFQFDIGAIERPNYAYLVYNAAKLAHGLGYDRVSVLEFGVAGGNGLLWLECHANWVEKIFPVKIEIYGFDTGEGLPEPKDYRDLQYHWKTGFFRMDQAKLKARIKRATLVLGNVKETSRTFVAKYNPAPIGAVSHDLDYYSSTIDALKLFDLPHEHILPRVFCYFDDVIGDDLELYNDFTGERAAIVEFNRTHTDSKLSFVYYLPATAGYQGWHHQIWSLHNFQHPYYGKFVSREDQQLRLDFKD